MSRETVQPADDMSAAAGVRGAVVVAHGGTEISTEPVTLLDPAVLRMIPLAPAIPGGGVEGRAGLARAGPPRGDRRDRRAIRSHPGRARRSFHGRAGGVP